MKKRRMDEARFAIRERFIRVGMTKVDEPRYWGRNGESKSILKADVARV